MIEVNKNGIQIEKTLDIIRCSYYVGDGVEFEMFFDSSSDGMRTARRLTIEEISKTTTCLDDK